MTDLHSHILPELDDGARSLSEALEMARIAVESGVSVMVATPHCAGDRADEVRASFDLLRSALEETGIPLRLKLGMELLGTPELPSLLREGKALTLNGSKYPLVEFSFHSSGEGETELLRELTGMGYRPLIAHPERYAWLQQEPEYLNAWTKMGCLFQINRGSLLGRFGGDAQELGLAMIDRGFATVVASDAHSARRRTPWLADIRELLNRDFSTTAAQYLLLHNPNMILQNKPLPRLEPEWF